MDDLDGIVVIEGLGLVGVLFIGVNVVKMFVFMYNLFLVGVYYIVGYIYVNCFEIEFKFLLFLLVVSGGYIELVLMKVDNEFEIIGEIRDDVVGEVYDKVVCIFGFVYLGGV